MIQNLKKLIKPITLFTILSSLYFSVSKAEIYKEIKVEGNERLSVETIIMFSGLNISEDLTINDLNLSIKKLYKTNYFKDIKITPKNNILKIIIIENPIIQSIKINGIKNKNTLSKLEEITAKSDLLKAQKEFKKICEDIDSQKWDNKKKADKKKEVFDYIISKLYSKEDVELFKKSMSNIVVIMPQGMSQGMSSNNDNYHTIEI